MAALFKKNSSRNTKGSLKTKKKHLGQNKLSTRKKYFSNPAQFIKSMLFLLFSTAVIIICFLGQKPKGQQIILNQPAPSRIVADFSFEYDSELLMKKKIAEVQAQVPPIFKRSFEPYNNFSETINTLNGSIAKTLIEHEAEGNTALEDALLETIRNLKEITTFDIDPETIIHFTTKTNPKERSALTNDALNVLKSIYEDGIYSNLNIGENSPQVLLAGVINKLNNSNLW